MNKLLVILGPTATGKTDLGLELARKFNGELVACDSRQVYKGLDIGTGKMPSTGRWKIEDGKWIVNGISIYMYEVLDPRIQYSVANYVKDAEKVINEIVERENLPIIVGGSGFYLKALFEELDSLRIPVNRKLRKKLQKLSLNELQKKLERINPDRWQVMNSSDRQNPRRLVRAIELGLSQGSKDSQGLEKRFQVLKVGLTAPREILYKRVDERVVSRINQGMIEEARNLNKNGLSLKRMRELGLEYRCLADYLSGKIMDINEDKGLIKIMQGEIHGYVRRQLTWFKKEKQVFWFDISEKNFAEKVEKLASNWYHNPNDTAN